MRDAERSVAELTQIVLAATQSPENQADSEDDAIEFVFMNVSWTCLSGSIIPRSNSSR